jgi:hypothetical protein
MVAKREAWMAEKLAALMDAGKAEKKVEQLDSMTVCAKANVMVGMKAETKDVEMAASLDYKRAVAKADWMVVSKADQMAYLRAVMKDGE